MPKVYFTPCMSAGDVVFVSGQRGAVDGIVVAGSIKLQLRRALSNIDEMLKFENLELSDVVKITLYIVNFENNIDEVNDEYVEIMGAYLPARSAVGVSALTGGALVAVDAIAARRVS